MADNIEKLLKKTRLDKQLSLDDINRDLKIRKDYIKQFEKKIPELLGVYELGYLRCYAKHLGVEKEVNNYIAYLKEKTKIASKNEKAQSENSITEILKNFLAKPKITFPILGVLVLVVFFIMTNKGYIKGFDNNKETKKQISEVTTDTHDQNNNIVNISESLSIQQKGPYNYLIQGINNTSDITNIVARVNTTFTIIDPAQNKVIKSGTIRVGERFSMPKIKEGNTLATILVKTNIPNAFDIKGNMS
ncbi:MAG: helix-turn-helix domain-containing protein [Rickettsiales bacterium]|nr:helix-turn-helix domain-containing protein [Rickettsiales bacterium]